MDVLHANYSSPLGIECSLYTKYPRRCVKRFKSFTDVTDNCLIDWVSSYLADVRNWKCQTEFVLVIKGDSFIRLIPFVHEGR